MIRKLYYHSNKTIPGDDKEEKELDQDRKRHNSILKDIAYKRKKVQWTGATKAKAYFLWPIIMLLEELGCTGLKNRISNYYIDDEFKKLKAANKML
jgi:hypothetical protein